MPVGITTWLACFCIATALGLGVALQRWFSLRGPGKPEFWDARFIQPQLIPWLAWAAIAPLLFFVLDRVPWDSVQLWKRVAHYVGIAAIAIFLQATVAGFALGWWWSFPNPIPMDPGWHIVDELKRRSAFSILIVWLIAATYHARWRATSVAPTATPAEPVPAPVEPTAPPASGPIALRTPDRVWFVDPGDIEWIEADGDYVVVHAGNGRHRVRDTISAMETRLPQGQLVRVSRSAIVNLSAIREMQRWFRGNFVIILRDGTRVTTGARYRERLTSRL